MNKNGFPDNALALLDQAAARIAALEAENARLREVIKEARRMSDEIRSEDGGEILAALCDRALEPA